MITTMEILGRFKDQIRLRFFEVADGKVEVPEGLVVPTTPEAALRLGMRLGRQQGYGNGLVDGTELGLDVGLEAVDAMLSQPIIFGATGAA